MDADFMKGNAIPSEEQSRPLFRRPQDGRPPESNFYKNGCPSGRGFVYQYNTVRLSSLTRPHTDADAVSTTSAAPRTESGGATALLSHVYPGIESDR